MSELILITGGARSGKSRFALSLGRSHGIKQFVATCVPDDAEMQIRVDRHRAERDRSWITIEEPVELAQVAKQCTEGVLLIDCMTLWLSNLFVRDFTDDQIAATMDMVCRAVSHRTDRTLIVTNEIGMGIVPDNPLARRFRDQAGRMNQRLGSIAQTVIWMISGIPVYVKKQFTAEDAE